MSSYRSRLPLKVRLRVSFTAIARVVTRPRQITTAALLAALVLGVLVWLPNIGLLAQVELGTHLSLLGRITFAISAYGSLFTNNSMTGGIILIVFSVLSGINGAMLVVVVPASFHQALSSGATNLWAVTAAALGAGCAACGTSFLAPLLGGIAGTASAALTQTLGDIVNVVGIILLLYSIYRLGIVAAGLPRPRKL